MGMEEKSRMLKKEEVDLLLERQSEPDGMEKIKILIVEDDPTTRLLYEKGLYNQIFDKKMAESGKEALLVYNDWRPDIIVLDIYLPEMTGYQVLKTIRATIEDRKTTIVMATAVSGSEDVMSCLKLGVEGYIVKPLQLAEIGVKILGYYAKKEPVRARKAEALCRELAKRAQVDLLMDKDKSKEKEGAKKTHVQTADTKATKAAAEDKTDETPAGKPMDESGK